MSTASPWIAGHRALDFANTVGGVRSGEHDEQLRDYGDLLAWAAACDVVDEEARRALAALAVSVPREAAAALQEARRAREAIHAVFLAVARKEPAAPADLSCLGRVLSDAHASLVIAPAGGAFELQWLKPPTLAQPLHGAVRSTADLLTNGPLHRVKVCASATCGWLFLDSSKSGSRQWCDMAVCGNRHKVARYKQRASALRGEGG